MPLPRPRLLCCSCGQLAFRFPGQFVLPLSPFWRFLETWRCCCWNGCRPDGSKFTCVTLWDEVASAMASVSKCPAEDDDSRSRILCDRAMFLRISSASCWPNRATASMSWNLEQFRNFWTVSDQLWPKTGRFYLFIWEIWAISRICSN